MIGGYLKTKMLNITVLATVIIVQRKFSLSSLISHSAIINDANGSIKLKVMLSILPVMFLNLRLLGVSV